MQSRTLSRDFSELGNGYVYCRASINISWCFIVLIKPYGCNGPYVVISLILVLQQPVINRYYANTPFYSCVPSCQVFEQE